MSDNLLETYNPLYDVHLRQYFALPHMQKHLRNLGLLESKLDIHAAAQDPHSGHHQMMDQLLRNRERVLQQMAEIQKKLDAAEKVELYRRIRSGITNVDELDRSHMSRSLSRPARSAKSRKDTARRERRHSGNFDANELIKRVEENYRSESGPFRNQRNIYNRLAANVYKYQYLHKLDDRTLCNYINSLRKSLQKLERFREVTFGPHTMARHQPSQLQQSWFFRRRSRQASSSKRAGKSQSPSKAGSAMDEGGPPTKLIRTSGSRTRGTKKLPPLQSKPLPRITPTLNTTLDESKARLPPAGTNRLGRKVELTPKVAKKETSAVKKPIPRKVKKEGKLEATVLPTIGGATAVAAAAATLAAAGSATELTQPSNNSHLEDVDKFQGPEGSVAPSPSISLAASQTTDQDLGSKAGSEWEEQEPQKGGSSMSGEVEELAGHTETRPTPEPFLEAESAEPEQLIVDNDPDKDGEETLRERRSAGFEKTTENVEAESVSDAITPDHEAVHEETFNNESPIHGTSETPVHAQNIEHLSTRYTPVEETMFVDEQLEREDEHEDIQVDQVQETHALHTPVHGEFEAYDHRHPVLEDEPEMGNIEVASQEETESFNMPENHGELDRESRGEDRSAHEAVDMTHENRVQTPDNESLHTEDHGISQFTESQNYGRILESPKASTPVVEHMPTEAHEEEETSSLHMNGESERPYSIDLQEHHETSRSSTQGTPRDDVQNNVPVVAHQTEQFSERPVGTDLQIHDQPIDEALDSDSSQATQRDHFSGSESEVTHSRAEEAMRRRSVDSAHHEQEPHQEIASPEPNHGHDDEFEQSLRYDEAAHNAMEAEAGNAQEIHRQTFESDNLPPENNAQSISNSTDAEAKDEVATDEHLDHQMVGESTEVYHENIHQESVPISAFDYYKEGTLNQSEVEQATEDRATVRIEVTPSPDHTDEDGYLVEPLVESAGVVDINGNRKNEDDHSLPESPGNVGEVQVEGDVNGNSEENYSVKQEDSASAHHVVDQRAESPLANEHYSPDHGHSDEYLVESDPFGPTDTESRKSPRSKTPTESIPEHESSQSFVNEPEIVGGVESGEQIAERNGESGYDDRFNEESRSPGFEKVAEVKLEEEEDIPNSEHQNSSSNTSLCDRESMKSVDHEIETSGITQEHRRTPTKRSEEEEDELVENEPVEENTEEPERKLSSANSYKSGDRRYIDPASEENAQFQRESPLFPEKEMAKEEEHDENTGDGGFVDSYKYENGPHSPPPSPKPNLVEENNSSEQSEFVAEHETKDVEIHQQDSARSEQGKNELAGHPEDNEQHHDLLEGTGRPATANIFPIAKGESKRANQLMSQPSIEITPASEYDPASADDNLSRLSAEPEEFTTAEEYYRMGSAHGGEAEHPPANGNSKVDDLPGEHDHHDQRSIQNQNGSPVDSPINGNGVHAHEDRDKIGQNGHKSDSDEEAKDDREDGENLDERSALLGKTSQHQHSEDEYELGGSHGSQI